MIDRVRAEDPLPLLVRPLVVIPRNSLESEVRDATAPEDRREAGFGAGAGIRSHRDGERRREPPGEGRGGVAAARGGRRGGGEGGGSEGPGEERELEVGNALEDSGLCSPELVPCLHCFCGSQ